MEGRQRRKAADAALEFFVRGFRASDSEEAESSDSAPESDTLEDSDTDTGEEQEVPVDSGEEDAVDAAGDRPRGRGRRGQRGRGAPRGRGRRRGRGRPAVVQDR